MIDDSVNSVTRCYCSVAGRHERENGVDIRDEDIMCYGIRDYGRQPYCGANHAWRPGQESRIVLRNLAAFGPEGSPKKNLHVYREAYSDYHGFLQGPLNSSCDVLHTIYPKHFETVVRWVCDEREHRTCADKSHRFCAGSAQAARHV